MYTTQSVDMTTPVEGTTGYKKKKEATNRGDTTRTALLAFIQARGGELARQHEHCDRQAQIYTKKYTYCRNISLTLILGTTRTLEIVWRRTSTTIKLVQLVG